MDFPTIYDTYQPKIRRYLIRLVGESEADDLTQEVFVKVNNSLAEFREEASLSTWVYRIATNSALDKLRSPAFHRSEPQIEDDDSGTSGKQPSAEQQVVRKQMDECLQSYMDRLPETQRTVFLLSELEGLKNKEIADILGISLGAVKIRLHRAKESLKADLMAHCDSYWVEDNEFVPNLSILK